MFRFARRATSLYLGLCLFASAGAWFTSTPSPHAFSIPTSARICQGRRRVMTPCMSSRQSTMTAEDVVGKKSNEGADPFQLAQVLPAKILSVKLHINKYRRIALLSRTNKDPVGLLFPRCMLLISHLVFTCSLTHMRAFVHLPGRHEETKAQNQASYWAQFRVWRLGTSLTWVAIPKFATASAQPCDNTSDLFRIQSMQGMVFFRPKTLTYINNTICNLAVKSSSKDFFERSEKTWRPMVRSPCWRTHMSYAYMNTYHYMYVYAFRDGRYVTGKNSPTHKKKNLVVCPFVYCSKLIASHETFFPAAICCVLELRVCVCDLVQKKLVSRIYMTYLCVMACSSLHMHTNLGWRWAVAYIHTHINTDIRTC